MSANTLLRLQGRIGRDLWDESRETDGFGIAIILVKGSTGRMQGLGQGLVEDRLPRANPVA